MMRKLLVIGLLLLTGSSLAQPLPPPSNNVANRFTLVQTCPMSATQQTGDVVLESRLAIRNPALPYTIAVGDCGAAFSYNITTAGTLTLPATTAISAGYFISSINNLPASTVSLTINPATGQNISGASTMILPPASSVALIFDGANWITTRGVGPNVLIITAGGNYTYNPSVDWVEAACRGGGGGGGGGNVVASGTATPGGGGGGSGTTKSVEVTGAVIRNVANVSRQITATIQSTLPTYSQGGAGVAAAGTGGTSGTAGGIAALGSLVACNGGGGGAGATATGAAGGGGAGYAAVGGTAAQGATTGGTAGLGGGQPGTPYPSTGTLADASVCGGAGGGAGGQTGLTGGVGNPTPRTLCGVGGAGGGGVPVTPAVQNGGNSFGPLILGGSASVAGGIGASGTGSTGGAGTPAAILQYADGTFPFYPGLGIMTGSGGAGGGNGIAGANGGAGAAGEFGMGGGGGGSCVSPCTSGAGGNGGPPVLMIIEHNR